MSLFQGVPIIWGTYHTRRIHSTDLPHGMYPHASRHVISHGLKLHLLSSRAGYHMHICKLRDISVSVPPLAVSTPRDGQLSICPFPCIRQSGVSFCKSPTARCRVPMGGGCGQGVRDAVDAGAGLPGAGESRRNILRAPGQERPGLGRQQLATAAHAGALGVLPPGRQRPGGPGHPPHPAPPRPLLYRDPGMLLPFSCYPFFPVPSLCFLWEVFPHDRASR